MIQKARAFFMYGAGGANLDPAGGMATLDAKVRAMGIYANPVPYDNSQLNQMIADINATPVDTLVITGGDSCGANYQGLVSQRARRRINYMFGIQPSLWCGMYPVASRVSEVLCIYNPYWWITLGLGAYRLIPAAGNTATKFRYLTTSDLHPGDQDVNLQNIILADIKRITA